MSVFRISGGVLEVSPMDGSAGIDNSLPGGPLYPSHGLPGAPPIPGNALPSPPAVWPPLTWHNPIQPAPPGTPPGSIWPPINPPHPGHALPGAGHPDNSLPGRPPRPGNALPPSGSIDNTLPTPPAHPGNGLPSKVYWVIAGIPGVGWRAVAVDPSLVAGMPLPPTESTEPAPKG